MNKVMIFKFLILIHI